MRYLAPASRWHLAIRHDPAGQASARAVRVSLAGASPCRARPVLNGLAGHHARGPESTCTRERPHAAHSRSSGCRAGQPRATLPGGGRGATTFGKVSRKPLCRRGSVACRLGVSLDGCLCRGQIGARSRGWWVGDELVSAYARSERRTATRDQTSGGGGSHS